MSALRPSTAAAVVRNTTRALQQQQNRSFSATPKAAASHGPQYDPPTGWLFGVKPGEKYQKEGWETSFFYGFCGSLVIAGIAYGFKPDTS